MQRVLVARFLAEVIAIAGLCFGALSLFGMYFMPAPPTAEEQARNRQILERARRATEPVSPEEYVQVGEALLEFESATLGAQFSMRRVVRINGVILLALGVAGAASRWALRKERAA